ncbi:ATP-dependent DNA helicase [Cellulomonas sp. PhB143]|uniref:ATP-dependent DNA helicase n=1 Tax=Cellulomonas sp. PhB143 TaxID=2485186 RepID=UPI000F47F831|nr:ATP-dependent DNA helicase [Cellulomonas sp. PhB143]ROS76859.1 DNA helicase-2/ATP-dependent DNA helicase PcrA [Cellulomonas sp. PhB143]
MSGRTALLGADDIALLLGRHLPTPEQRAVIEAPLEPMLVVAGAGSGKTETMAARVVWLVANGLVAPESVLGLTFTRKAAGELAERVRARLARLARAQGRPDDLSVLERPTVATYNAYAGSLVSDHGLRAGIEPGSRLLSDASQWQVAAEVVESWTGDLETGPAFSTAVRAVLELSGAMSEHLVGPDDARAGIDAIVREIEAVPFGARRTSHYADVTALLRLLADRRRVVDLVQDYRERKRLADSLDFGDQIAVAARLARGSAHVRDAERARYDVVLLDEYQDTSYAQTELLAALFGDGHPVTAVGDPHQSIYGWRGASASGLSRFPERFGRSDGSPAPVHYLATSWRNDQAVLDAANLVAEPLRGASGVRVPQLGVRPGAGAGQVSAVYATTVEEEAEAVAAFVQERWRPATDAAGTGRVTAAVLCRARSQFVPLEVALRARGLPVEVVGLGGLLTTPEVVDVVALLEAAHDPSRGDALARILTGPRVRLGAADLHALASRAADLARADAPRGDGGSSGSPADGTPAAVVAGDVVDHRSIVDALDDLPAPGVPARDGRVLSDAGHARLTALARTLRTLRSETYLSLPELVGQAERALGLDIEVGLAEHLSALRGTDVGSGDRGRAHLDAFRDVAASFAQQSDVPTLGAFLAWLGAAVTHERGLDLPLRPPDPDAVQVVTVHAAKGLEWDVVAVPGLSDGVFPSTASGDDGPRDSGWLTGLGALPYPLRGDRADLPAIAVADAESSRELRDLLQEFKAEAGEHKVAEERRLAYVALTRARRDLLLAGAWWRGGARPVPPSPFLTELADARVVDPDGWAGEPEGDNPRGADAEEPVWPRAPAPGGVEDLLRRTARRVREADGTDVPGLVGGTPEDPTPGAAGELVRLARLLLAERSRRREQDAPALPAHLSASAMVRLADDRDEFLRQLRRPVPGRPTRHARVGTGFHAWVEQYFTSSSLLDLWDLTDLTDLEDATDAETPAGPGATGPGAGVEAEVAQLRERFLASPWARRTPVAVEVDVETPVAGTMLRSRIDAVFPEEPGAGAPGSVVVVDWKTGQEPRDAASRRAREVQLAVYRLAWSRWSGLPVERVHAAFCYVATGTTVRPDELLDEAGLEALVRSAGGAA